MNPLGAPTGPETIRTAAERALGRGRFFVGAGTLRVEHVGDEHAKWEVYRGHLLDPAHARQTAAFESWHLFLDTGQTESKTPLLSILWQADASAMHIVRRILTRGYEAYEDSPGVVLSRPAEKWAAELVGTIDLRSVEAESLEAELASYVFLAIVGTSRLPITSLESPLPSFSLGRLAYLPTVDETQEAWTDPLAFLRAALDGAHSTLEQAKALETALRATPADQLPGLVQQLEAAMPERRDELDWPARLFRTVFNTTALSPYTEFAERMIGAMMRLAGGERWGPAEAIDTFGYMLRHLCRHLTAYDLRVFHNFGANYPDALFLDALLAAYFQLIENHPGLFQDSDDMILATAARLRRRALRQACLLRKHYEGHLVPDAPTSMGENLRVLPAEFAPVPEEQIVQIHRRRKALFEGRPLEDRLDASGREVLDASLADLELDAELRELGMAHFLDRPLGIFKAPGEVDRTPLVSYEAFSRSIAGQRIARLHELGWLAPQRRAELCAALDRLRVPGLAAAAIAAVERPGVVSLADANKAAADFLILRTTRGSLDALLARYDLRPLAALSPQNAAWLASARDVLLAQQAPADAPRARARLVAYDRQQVPMLELAFDAEETGTVEYRERGGVELVERLRVTGVGQGDGDGLKRPDPAVWIELHSGRS